jgi:hypothetical protein
LDRRGAHQINKTGNQNYLAQQIKEDEQTLHYAIAASL